METAPTIENAVTWFNAKTVTHHLDVVDRQVASIVDTRTSEGSTVRIYNAAGFEFMTLTSSRSPTCRWSRTASSGAESRRWRWSTVRLL